MVVLNAVDASLQSKLLSVRKKAIRRSVLRGSTTSLRAMIRKEQPMKYIISLALALTMFLAPLGLINLPGSANGTALAYSGIPTFSIVKVVKDTSVTIKTNNFPADDVFNVTMNYMGTRGVGGIKVDTVDTGDGGSFTLTFDIPAALRGQYQIAIRLQSPSSGYFAYNWFYNNVSGSGGSTGGSGFSGIPTFSIVSVDKNTSVTILTNNFPAKDKFVVRMGLMGTRGVGGVEVDQIKSGSGGSFKATFAIPASLKGERQIAIRLESPTSGFFAYNWFYNAAGGSSGGGTTPVTVPTISIASVVKNKSVTINAHNFPADTHFDVLMNYMGTRGVGGVKVDSIDSGSGGDFTATFSIPASLKGQFQIAIRLQGTTTGFFAYNWFYNTTTN
jgi:hypothetical protein